MCLTVSPKATLAYKNCRRKLLYVTLWKVLVKSYNMLVSPYFTKYKWKPGQNTCGFRVEIYNNFSKRIVNESIHVCVTKEEAQIIFLKNQNAVIVPVRCYLKDLVAVNSENKKVTQAAFRKVYLLKKDYNNALRD